MKIVNFTCLVLAGLTSLLALFASFISADANQEREVYIVYMGSLSRNQLYTTSSHHISLLQKVVGQNFQENLMVISYNKSFNGFAAKLTQSEIEELSALEDVVSVFPDKKYNLLTTRSWDFLGLKETAPRNLQLESDIIIGVIDTGIWPELPSFNDEGFGPPPKKWKGACKGGVNFTCNNKLIGARYYGTAKSARDEEGHGSHTASIAAGVAVKNISFFGLAEGTARGGVPSARIAAYNACGSGCSTASILAAFDDAIADGVDILSVSIGWSGDALPVDQDAIAIGAFHAMDKGILTVTAAGNDYNVSYGSTTSVAPWMISVAASSTDRRIIDKAVLGNGRTLVGLSVNSFSLNGTNFPLVNGNISTEVKGKIVLGFFTSDVNISLDEGAIGIIYLSSNATLDWSTVVPFPGAALSIADYEVAVSYLNSTKDSMATILPSEAVKDPSAPIIASFSSCGPNAILQEIMKPDVSAPGVDILAGYSPMAPTSNFPNPADTRKVTYNFLSGTSMACPHVAGVAAYVKSFHPDWSPSAIQSAIMTTATPMSATTHLLGEFAYGTGQINPTNATQPGLVYEALKEDYLKLLCRVGFDQKKLRAITGDNSSCPTQSQQDPVLDFNYPSLTARVAENKPFMLQFNRRVTNVGQANSVYKATVAIAKKFTVKVDPEVLSFSSLNEKKFFNVTISGSGFAKNLFESVALVWSDGLHNVRTPIIVNTIQPGLLIPPLIDDFDEGVSKENYKLY